MLPGKLILCFPKDGEKLGWGPVNILRAGRGDLRGKGLSYTTLTRHKKEFSVGEIPGKGRDGNDESRHHGKVFCSE